MAFIRNAIGGESFENFEKRFSGVRPQKSNENMMSNIKMIIDPMTVNSEDISSDKKQAPVLFTIVLGRKKDLNESLYARSAGRLKCISNQANLYNTMSDLVENIIPHLCSGGRLVAEFPTNITKYNYSKISKDISTIMRKLRDKSLSSGQLDEYISFNSPPGEKENLGSFYNHSQDFDWFEASDEHTSFLSAISEGSSNSHVSVSIRKHETNQFNLVVIVDSYWAPASKKIQQDSQKLC